MQLPLKTYGGKFYLASRIVAIMPKHLHYVEPFFGGGSVLLARDPEDRTLWLPEHRGVSELVNDIDDRLITFWRVIHDPVTFEEFARRVQAVPFARHEWERAHRHEYGRDTIADAVAFFVCCRQSWSGVMTTFSPVTRTRIRRRMNGNVSEWLSAVEGLPVVHARLRRVAIENMDAFDLIRREDTPHTLLYVDPPYLHETRTATRAYRHEMTEEQHRELLDVLMNCKSKVMLSGYPSDLYDSLLTGWTRHTFDLPNNAAGGTKKRRMTEVLWCRF